MDTESDFISVPDITCPLSEELYQVLVDHINPLADSLLYGEDLYIRVLDFVINASSSMHTS